MLIIIILIMGPDGTVSKQTTETPVATLAICETVQLKVIYSEIPKHMKLVSVTCSTTGEA
jgi:hypothetical protein